MDYCLKNSCKTLNLDFKWKIKVKSLGLLLPTLNALLKELGTFSIAVIDY